MPLSKEPSKLTADELAQEMWKRPDSLDHLQARAELERRRSRYTLISAIGTSASAIAAASAPSWPPMSLTEAAARHCAPLQRVMRKRGGGVAGRM
jgi:hypothetical protein